MSIYQYGISYNKSQETAPEGRGTMHRIRDLREDHDLKQRDLHRFALLAGLLLALRDGEREIPLRALVQLAAYYGTSVDYLLDLTDDPRPYPRKTKKK